MVQFYIVSQNPIKLAHDGGIYSTQQEGHLGENEKEWCMLTLNVIVFNKKEIVEVKQKGELGG